MRKVEKILRLTVEAIQVILTILKIVELILSLVR